MKVDKSNHYIIVETDEGNWGLDVNGMYLEKLLQFQYNIDNYSFLGNVCKSPNPAALEMAARGIGDNVLFTIECGNCKNRWIDGLRYMNMTVVKCPHCKALNRVSTTDYEVYFVK